MKSHNLHSIIFKVTTACSLKCDYCYVRPHYENADSNFLDLSIIEKVIASYVYLAKQGRGRGNKKNGMEFIWHGGEPTLAGDTYYQSILETQRRLIDEADILCKNVLVTNAVSLTDKLISIFAKGDFHIAVSFDGPKEYHDLHRRYPNGSGTFEDVVTGIAKLKEANIPISYLTVITKELASNPVRFFNFLVDYQLENVGLLPFANEKEQNWLSPNLYSNFMTKLFDLWFDHDDPKIQIREFTSIISRIFGRKTPLCDYAMCSHAHLAVDTNGDVFVCDLFIGNPSYKIGNLQNTALENLLSSPAFISHSTIAGQLPNNCIYCEFKNICCGGCRFRRTIDRHRKNNVDIFCEARKQIISHILRKLSKSDSQHVCRTQVAS